MRAMILRAPHEPLEAVVRDVPDPASDQVRIEVSACAVCRTDLHIVDGELTEAKLPVVLGHQVVGRVDARGAGVDTLAIGQRVGVPWLAGACGACRYCNSSRENLCDDARFTGYHVDGGYAEYAIAEAGACLPLEADAPDEQVAPLLCAGIIGYRALTMCGPADRVGLYGFGAAAHILAQVLRHQGRRVFAFTRPDDVEAQQFARDLGVEWAGGSNESAPTGLEAAIIFAPVGGLVIDALRAVDKGGVVVCGGIHMSDIPSFPYADLWGERVVRSVANLTRKDGEEFLSLAAAAKVQTHVHSYALGDANQALDDLRRGRLSGSAVLTVR